MNPFEELAKIADALEVSMNKAAEGERAPAESVDELRRAIGELRNAEARFGAGLAKANEVSTRKPAVPSLDFDDPMPELVKFYRQNLLPPPEIDKLVESLLKEHKPPPRPPSSDDREIWQDWEDAG